MTWLWITLAFIAGWLAHRRFIKTAFRWTMRSNSPKAVRLRARLRWQLGADEGVPGDIFDALSRAWAMSRDEHARWMAETDRTKDL